VQALDGIMGHTRNPSIPNLSRVFSGGQVWMQPPDVPVDMDRLMPLVQRGRGPPVRTCLERRLRAMLRDRGKRFCR
jgi:hypothetical protein